MGAVPARQPGASDHSARNAVGEAEDGTGKPRERMAWRPGERCGELQTCGRTDQRDGADAEEVGHQGGPFRPGMDAVLAAAGHGRPPTRLPLIGTLHELRLMTHTRRMLLLT